MAFSLRKMKRAFNAAALAFVATVAPACAALAGGGHDRGFNTPDPDGTWGHALTQGEKEFVHSIFSDGVETSIVLKHFRDTNDPARPSPTTAACVPYADERDIYFFGKGYESKDFSQDSTFRYEVFIHEITHIWQGQTHYRHTGKYEDVPKDDPLSVYRYTLDSSSKFEKLSVERQGAVIGDYACRFLHPAHSFPVWYQGFDRDVFANDRLLMKVVEGFFPQAKKARLAVEKTRAQGAIAAAREAESTASPPRLPNRQM